MKEIVFLFVFSISVLNTIAQPCAPIVSPTLSANTKKEFEQKLAAAKSDYEKDTANADAIIWYGRRTAYTGDYMKAIDIFSKGIAAHPGDARLYRHRGHRYITVRCFDKAIGDLTKAAELMTGKYDEVEPDGLPNAQNIPTSTLQTNIYYHLGLAYFLKGDFENAEGAYQNGLLISTNDDMYVAMANWLYIILLTKGETRKAEQVFGSINPSPTLIENLDYMSILDFYRSRPADNEIIRYTDATYPRISKDTATNTVKAATLYFGAGYYARLNGMKQKSIYFFEKAIATGQWASFGYIAAEACLKRKE
jgi:tetratricopeptide (TPR) repeat protein